MRCIHCKETFVKRYEKQMGKFRFCLAKEECVKEFNKVLNAQKSSINMKEKKCKGTGKAKGFESCGGSFLERTYGLCRGCYSKWLLNTEEGKKKVVEVTLKVMRPKIDLENAKDEFKSQKSLQYLRVNTMNACHDYVKLRDKGKPCVSCGEPWHSDHQAGHWKKASDYSSLKYNELNINNQCQGCNLLKDGNVQKYGDRIHLRIGLDGKEELERLALEYKKTPFKWDRIKLVELRKYYNDKIKELKKSVN